MVRAELTIFNHVMDLTIEELIDAAFGGNIKRRHQLKDCLYQLKEVELLINAQESVNDLWEEVLKETEEIEEELPNG